MSKRRESKNDESPAGPTPTGGRRGRAPRWLPTAILSFAALLLVASLATVLLAVLFARGNPVLSRRIVALISTAIGSDSTRLESDRIHGSLLGGAVLEHPRLVVLTPDGPVTWMSARRLRADYDLFKLLLSRNRTLKITIDSPVLPLVHDRRGNLVVPRFRASKQHPLEKTATRIDIAFHGGAISLDRGGVRFGKIEGNAVASLENHRTTVRVAKLSGVSEMPGRPGKIRAEGTAVVTDGRMRVEPLYVALDRTRVRSAVEWDLAKARVISSRTGFAPLDLAETMRLLDLAPVTRGTLVGEVGFSGDPASGVATLRLSGTVAGEPVDALLARASLVPGAVRVESVRARVRQAEISGRAVVETRGILTAEAQLHNVDPALLPWWRLPKNTPHGLLNGMARVRARKARPYPAAEVALDLDAGNLGRFTIDRGMVHARLGERGDVTIDTAWVDTPGARLITSGKVAADTSLAFSFEAQIRDLSAMDELIRPLEAESGRGRVVGTVAGRSSRPEYQMQGILTAGRLTNGMGFDSLRLSSRGRLGTSPLATADLTVVRLRAGPRPLGDVVSSVTISDKITINRYRQAFGDTTLTFHGEVRFHGKEAAATLDTLHLAIGELEWRNIGFVEASLEGDRLRVSHLTLGTDSGQLDAVGSVWLRENRVDARGTLQRVDLSRVLGPRDSRATPRGIADADWLMAGPLSDPEIQANFRVSGPRFGGIQGDSLSADLKYTPGLLSISEARWVSGSGRLSVAGSARPRLTFQDWARSLSRGDHAWASRVDLALQGNADSLDVSSLGAIDTSLASLHGFVTGIVRITGTAADPTLAISAHGSALAFQGVQADIGEFTGSYVDRRLTIVSLDVHRGGATSHVEGSIPVDLSLYGSRKWIRSEPISLKLRMVDADFGLATLFIPEFAASAGKLNMTADLKGTPAHPEILGSLKLVDGVLRVAGRDEVLDGLEVDATFDQNQVSVSRIAAREGKRGRVTGAGWWKPVTGRHWGDYEFRLHASEFTATDRETYMFRFSGDFLVQDAVNPDGAEVPRITSVTPATLSRGELTMDLSQPREELAYPMPFLYEIVIDVPRNLWYRNLDTEVELSNGQLTLRNEGMRDLILGSLEVKGKYYLYSNEFHIVDGEIDFTTLDRIDPDINIEAQTTVPSPDRAQGRATIYQTLSGRSSHLKVHLHDDQNSGEAYLWKLLTIGQFTTAGNELSATQNNAAPTAGPDVTLPVTNYLFRNAERWLGDVGFIDTIDLKSGKATGPNTGTSPIGLFGVGKYVTPELYVRYSRDFSSTAEQKISAEYRVTRHLLLRGEQIRSTPAAKDQAAQQYNLDLKVRLEY